MLAVALEELVHHVITSAFVDSRRKLSERLTTKCGGVQKWSRECTRTLGPVVVATLRSATSSDVDQCA
jgi:hypothetical protein